MSAETRWLLTVTVDIEIGQLAVELRVHHVHFDDPHPVPLGSDELVVGCWGPSDLPERLRARPHPAVLGIHPDSPQELFG